LNKFLLDTNVLYWLSHEPFRLDESIISSINDLNNDVYTSIVSLWELAIKSKLGKIRVNENLFNEVEALGCKLLEIA
jgi:PIN domain nuclease of toxin-antitoxin system